MERPVEQHPPLIRALLKPDVYDHAVEKIQLIETHISWVILTGPYAYKIKKPVNFGFLDFSTLDKRRFYCEEELHLNRRLAPAIYLAVVAICGSEQQPVMNGTGKAIEYAVKMTQFPQQAQLDRMLAKGTLHKQHMDAFARLVADFHARVEVAGSDMHYGDLAHVYQPVVENFSQIRERVTEADLLSSLDTLEQWCQRCREKLRTVFQQRKAQGFVRECHGDMHLRNLAWIDETPVAFDCIEFNPDLRWIDVISEVAFLVMDLQDRGQPGLAQRFLNAYLEHTGDYAGLRLMPFYLVYRALVRAKVDAIRFMQTDIVPREAAEVRRDFLAYLDMAQRYTQSGNPRLVLTHGPSGVGKTTLTQPLLELLGAIRIRSDVERKRLAGIPPRQSGRTEFGGGIYSQDYTARTYDKLLELTGQILDAGYTVIVDATFSKHSQRLPFQQLAQQREVAFVILDFIASAAALRERIMARRPGVSDADLSVLEHQLADWQALEESEQRFTLRIDTEVGFDAGAIAEQIAALDKQR